MTFKADGGENSRSLPRRLHVHEVQLFTIHPLPLGSVHGGVDQRCGGRLTLRYCPRSSSNVRNGQTDRSHFTSSTFRGTGCNAIPPFSCHACTSVSFCTDIQKCLRDKTHAFVNTSKYNICATLMLLNSANIGRCPESACRATISRG